MITSLFISFREGLEAFLVIGIILVYLNQISRKDLAKYSYLGAIVGFIASIAGGLVVFRRAQELEGKSGEIFEGIMMLLAAGLIAYFIVWLGTKAGNISSDIKNKVSKNTNAAGLFILSFLSVFREGLELAVYTLTKINENAMDIAIGNTLGLLASVIVTYIIFKSSVKLNLKLLFMVLGLILAFFGAEMFAEGILKLSGAAEEPFEIMLMAVYAIPSFYMIVRSYFIKSK